MATVPDRIHRDLLAMPASDALLKISHWLEDCQQHLDLKRPGGLPTAPFSHERAAVVVRRAAGVGVKPDYAPGDEIVMHAADGAGMAVLATQEWFETNFSTGHILILDHQPVSPGEVELACYGCAKADCDQGCRIPEGEQ